MSTKRTPELLAPAGSLTMLKTAFSFGADAIYAGQPRYSLRVRNNEFGSLDILQEAIEYTHQLGKKFFLVSNILPHASKTKTYVRDMTPVMALKPDALIMSDPGLISLVRKHWPEQAIHLSVQANTVNAEAVHFWRDVGISRVILSRELSLDEIAYVRDECPDTELEVFVHGALCMAYSGRCLLSGYFNQRDANQGSCTNSCRWEYKVKSEESSNSYDHHKTYVLEEPLRRAGEYSEIEEDEHGTYILNSKDLRAIEHIQKLVEIGIDSFKIEGRTKSAYYVARASQAYRHAIVDAIANRPFNPNLLRQLEGLANRGYTDGFFVRHHDAATQNYLRGYSESNRSRYVGDIVAWDEARQCCAVAVRNRFSVGDRCEVIHPSGNYDIVVTDLADELGEQIPVAKGSGHTVYLKLPANSVGGFLARYVAADDSAETQMSSTVAATDDALANGDSGCSNCSGNC